MADWICAKCGERAPAHAVSTSTCIWEPVDMDWLSADRSIAWLAGAQWATRRWTGHEVDPRDFEPVIEEWLAAQASESLRPGDE